MLGYCDNCRDPLTSPWDTFEERVEYRRVAKLARARTWRIRLLCRSCAELVWRKHDNPSGVEQGALL
jgi:hypothetical protein